MRRVSRGEEVEGRRASKTRGRDPSGHVSDRAAALDTERRPGLPAGPGSFLSGPAVP